jgi:putative transposase
MGVKMTRGNIKARGSEVTKRHDHSSVTLLAEHLVITTKYRGKVLKGRVATECERIMREVCDNINIEIIQIAIEPEHAHILLQQPPKLSISVIVEKIKSNSSRILRQRFPHLKKWCKKALWSRGFHAVSIGHGHDTVRKYIESQGTNNATSGFKGNVGRLPNMVGQPDVTLKQRRTCNGNSI